MLKETIKIIYILLLLSLFQELTAQGEPIVFSVTGDVPYGASEVPDFQQQIADHNLYSPSEFFAHLGDIKKQSDPCDESVYSDVASYLMELAVPVFIVPGDNETTDCEDETQAWNFWVQYFLNFELNFCGAPVAENQIVQPENFAFVKKGVLFIGINLVSGISSSIMTNDADWVEQQLEQKVSQVRGAVIFSQSGPSSSRATFFDIFDPAAQTFAKPVLFIHGDGHEWMMDNPFSASNVLRVQVDDGGSEAPVQITVTMDPQDMFSFLRDPFSGNPQLHNVMPCVQAGSDQQISLASAANLQGKVSDDGVPTSPGNLSTTWTKVNGPGTVTFDNPNNEITTASFSLPGMYLLRLIADDGDLQNDDELFINVTEDTSLPVELTIFTAKTFNDEIIVNWETESELNNIGFELYRSLQKDADYSLISNYKANPDLAGQGNSGTRHEYSYTDRSVEPETTYWYKLADLDYIGVKTFHGPISVTAPRVIPTDFELRPNYPNPFNTTTTVRFNIPHTGSGVVDTKIIIYNVLGRVTKTLFQDKLSVGSYEVKWDGTTNFGNYASSGIYILEFKANEFSQTGKLVLIK
jgi:hypothetical protein